MKRINTIGNSEKGMVSIIAAIVFVVILTLTVASFAAIVRREQRQALDRQLSTLAFYGAESGVNDAVNQLKSNPNYTNDDCSRNTQELGNNISYSCVLVDTTPSSLVYSPVDTNQSTIVKMTAPGATSLSFSWQPNEGEPNYVRDTEENPISAHNLPTSNSNSSFAEQVRDSGILRLSVIPVRDSGISRDGLINETQTIFLYPNLANNSGEKTNYAFVNGTALQGNFVNGQCHPESTPNNCNITITNLPAGVDSYYVRLKSIYKQHKVQITANTAAGGQISFGSTQAVIDATGKANDVLRRIQVRVPLSTAYVYPESGLETTASLCKMLVLLEPLEPGARRGADNPCVSS